MFLFLMLSDVELTMGAQGPVGWLQPGLRHQTSVILVSGLRVQVP